MSQAGDSVGAISSTMTRISARQGLTHSDAIVLPTAVMVEGRKGGQSRVQFGSNTGGTLRFDQVSALYELIARLETTAVDPVKANDELNRIDALPPKFPWLLRVLGYSLFAMGFALMLQPTWQTLIACSLLGIFIGALYLSKLPTVQVILPVLVAFLVTTAVLIATQHFDFQDPIRILVPALVMFLPGGALTIAVIELASDQMVAGASRLISGVVQLLLLAFGILAATQLVGASLSDLQDDPVGSFGVWIMILAIPLYLVGLMLLFCCPWRYFPWMLAVLVVAYLGQLIGTVTIGAQLSGFLGALAMTPLVLWFDRLPNGPSKLITFLPAFWMLVPGSTGLMAVVDAGSSTSQDALGSVIVSVFAIALGILIGTAVFATLLRTTTTFDRDQSRLPSAAESTLPIPPTGDQRAPHESTHREETPS